jgi:hypothetical protein
MPASRKKRGRNFDFDEYILPNPSGREDPDPAPQERHTHYELHGRAKHSLITIPASPPSYAETDNFDGDMTADEHPSYFNIEESDEYQEHHNCELEALGLGEILGQTFEDDRKKRRRTQAVSSILLTTCQSFLFILIGPSTSHVDSLHRYLC